MPTFLPEQAPIFFGRGPEIDQLLRQFSGPEVRFVAVVGVSGSGKSSLVKAGVLPRLRAGIIGNAPWIDVCFKPGERGGNPFLALAFVLKDALGLTGRTEPEIARALQSNPKEAEAHVCALLAKHPAAGELLLFIDQFEELFTQSGPSDRRDFLAFVDSIVVHRRVRVIVTMRADFFGLAIEEPTLAKLLRRDRGTFPLDPPGIGALHEMIIRPAEAAGLELQEGLAQRLLDDAAGEGPGKMSLIAFTLSQLYDHRKAQTSVSRTTMPSAACKARCRIVPRALCRVCLWWRCRKCSPSWWRSTSRKWLPAAALASPGPEGTSGSSPMRWSTRVCWSRARARVTNPRSKWRTRPF